MKRLNIVPIVEGHGEVDAVPLLVERWLKFRGFHRYFEVSRPAVRASGCGAIKCPHDEYHELGVEYYVDIARGRPADAILVVLDADDECLSRTKKNPLGPWLLGRAKAVAGNIPVGVVIANREFESWYLASLSRMRRLGLLRADVRFPAALDTEATGSGKSHIEKLLGRPYEETTHMRELVPGISFTPGTQRRSRSFRKLLSELDRLTAAARTRRAA